MNHTESSRRYLFFISQDYSFPVLRPLQDAIWAKGDEVKWFMYGDEMHKTYILPNESVLETVEEMIDFNPHAVFVPGNVVPSFIPGLKVQVFHGLPSTKAKKMVNFIIISYVACLICIVLKEKILQVNL